MLSIIKKHQSKLAAIFLITASAAYGWGIEGHQVVALVAEQNLSPVARNRINELLALEPGSTLASISTWADEHRSPSTAPWHYVNLPRGDCNYVLERDCPDSNCIVGAIERQSAILRSNASPADRLKALKYLVHLVADAHQPLHAGFADDRGGNTYQLQAFGRGTNLHAVWDSGMIKAIQPDSAALAEELRMALPSLAMGTAKDWVKESCEIVNRPDFYPPRKLPDSYVETFGPVLESRLQLAGLSLAALLNRN